ncbi:hypothetical protein HYC85_010493 [Camellia sinensis]|uniref:Uncharacterized protein n=1 Tax=Camellia sinensis TaxID=4442 RepID=A0A7J7HIK3_CAMSI|nr:hypothetical protein HYC85_010493 [Camellia sinensis]
MLVRFSLRIAVVTGGNKGIGLEICRQLASNEVMVILTARDEKRDSASVASLADYIKNKFGKLNMLAEMAKKVIKQTYETAEGRLRTNYYRPKQLSQALIPLLRLSSSARIVNVLSSLGQLKNVTNEWAREDAKGDLLKAGLFSLLMLSPKQLLMATRDMSFNNGHYTDEQGAKGPVKLALTVGDGPSSLFFFQREETTF